MKGWSPFKKETKVEGSKHDKGGVGDVKRKINFRKQDLEIKLVQLQEL